MKKPHAASQFRLAHRSPTVALQLYHGEYEVLENSSVNFTTGGSRDTRSLGVVDLLRPVTVLNE